MTVLIIQTFPRAVNGLSALYNRQEIGLAKALNRKSHHCDVVYFGGKNAREITLEYAPGHTFTVFYLKGIAVLKNGLFKGLSKLAERYDILQPGEYDQLETWYLAKRFPEKVVVYHGPYHCDFNKRYNMKCRLFDKFFLNTYRNRNTPFLSKSRMATKFLENKGLFNVTTVGVSLDPEQLRETDKEHPFVSDLRTDEYRYLLYIGRLEPRRNITFLLDVCRTVMMKCPDLKLVLIGDGEEEYKTTCFTHATRIGIHDKIVYRQELEQLYLPALYRLCSVFLLPSIYEIFGMVLLEAMYYGLPVVTSLNGGADMLIQSGENGVIVDSWAVDAWGKAVLTVIGTARSIGNMASQTIRERFTWDILADSFIHAYNKALSKRFVK